jgi:hypothetical protein
MPVEGGMTLLDPSGKWSRYGVFLILVDPHPGRPATRNAAEFHRVTLPGILSKRQYPADASSRANIQDWKEGAAS